MLMGRDEYFPGLCHFFQLKFLMALKVGISACMLDGVPSRRVGVYLEGFGGKILSGRCLGMGAYSLGIVLDFVFFLHLHI